MLHNSLSWTAAHNKAVAEARFQQDSATFYTGRIVMQFWYKSLGKRQPLGMLFYGHHDPHTWTHRTIPMAFVKIGGFTTTPSTCERIKDEYQCKYIDIPGGGASDHCCRQEVKEEPTWTMLLSSKRISHIRKSLEYNKRARYFEKYYVYLSIYEAVYFDRQAPGFMSAEWRGT